MAATAAFSCAFMLSFSFLFVLFVLVFVAFCLKTNFRLAKAGAGGLGGRTTRSGPSPGQLRFVFLVRGISGRLIAIGKLSGIDYRAKFPYRENVPIRQNFAIRQT